jgi:hypothetical protein
MPIVIGIAALAVVGIGLFLFAGSAQAGEPEPMPEKKKTPIVSGRITIKAPKLEEIDPPTHVITPTPTPGAYYQIVKDDIGSALAVKAYGSARPTARWLAVAAHPLNRVRLAVHWSQWFMPSWQAQAPMVFSMWKGQYTGMYAVVYFPPTSEVPV